MKIILTENGLKLKMALFMHIQKCAGTSVVNLAVKYYGNNKVCSHGDFLGKPPSDFYKVPFVSGHFGYDFAKTLMPGRYCFVFLREPADRILSFYYFCRQRDPNQFEMYKLAQELNLEQFLQYAFEDPLARSRIWNNQTWQLAHGYGKQDKRSIVNFTEGELLKLAKSHLSEFDYVGFTETFDRDKKIILKKLGIVDDGSVTRLNVTKDKPSMHELPLSTRKLLDQLTELDREIYRYAGSLRQRSWLQRILGRL